LRWSALLGAKSSLRKAAKKKPASNQAVKAVGSVTKKDSKLVEDEEASAAAVEPMGSVAAAVARDQGSSTVLAKKAEPSKLQGKDLKN
jgi:hypothetical protein